jgi:hypothetical protein
VSHEGRAVARTWGSRIVTTEKTHCVGKQTQSAETATTVSLKGSARLVTYVALEGAQYARTRGHSSSEDTRSKTPLRGKNKTQSAETVTTRSRPKEAQRADLRCREYREPKGTTHCVGKPAQSANRRVSPEGSAVARTRGPQSHCGKATQSAERRTVSPGRSVSTRSMSGLLSVREARPLLRTSW